MRLFHQRQLGRERVARPGIGNVVDVHDNRFKAHDFPRIATARATLPALLRLHCMTLVKRGFEADQCAHPNQTARADAPRRTRVYGAITLSGVIGVLRTRRPVA